MATLQGFTNGTPNWTVDSYFIRMSPQRAQVMQEWFKAGTNAAQFSITNAAKHAVRLFPIAQFETDGRHQDTPVLSARNYRGVYVGPGEAVTVQVAELPHEGRWRIGFSYNLDDETAHLFQDAARDISSAIKRSPSGNADPFRDSVTFYSDWVKR